uniref:Fe2OG dioxygenase domain-containing protein n=1 Tax=Macrostomum lignano TaxID=282301 RepID=A0A1I8IVA5_9PLAT
SWLERHPSADRAALQQQLRRLQAEGIFSRCAAELLAEQTRRESEDEASFAREAEIASRHVYKNPDLFSYGEVSQRSMFDPRFVAIVEACRHGNKATPGVSMDDLRQYGLRQVLEDVYFLPVFSPSFCSALRSEFSHFSDHSPVKTGRPNTMNRDGLLLDELRPIRAWLDRLRSDWLQPLVDCLLPEAANGAKLDSHRAFTVRYLPGRDTGLGYHYDNAEATLNVCLTDSNSYHGNALYFGDLVEPKLGGGCPLISPERLEALPGVEQRLGWGLLHPGLRMHGVRRLLEGTRLNLILWLRASRLRNRLCPRCWRRPECTRLSQRYDVSTNALNQSIVKGPPLGTSARQRLYTTGCVELSNYRAVFADIAPQVMGSPVTAATARPQLQLNRAMVRRFRSSLKMRLCCCFRWRNKSLLMTSAAFERQRLCWRLCVGCVVLLLAWSLLLQNGLELRDIPVLLRDRDAPFEIRAALPKASVSASGCPANASCIAFATRAFGSYSYWNGALQPGLVPSCASDCRVLADPSEAHALLFHGFDLPSRRRLRQMRQTQPSSQLWIYYSQESPVHLLTNRCVRDCLISPWLPFAGSALAFVKEFAFPSYLLRNYPDTTEEAGYFNWTVTYRRDSTIYLPHSRLARATNNQE